MCTHTGEVNLRHLSLRAAHLALGVSYWDLGLIIEAQLAGQGWGVWLQGSSRPHLPASRIPQATCLTFYVTFPSPIVTTEPPPLPTVSPLTGPSFQRCLVTQGHSQQPHHLHCPSLHSWLPLHTSLGLLPSVLVSSEFVAENPSSPAFCILGLH